MTAARAPRIGVVHTSPATVELFGKMLRERLAGVEIVNILDDSILPELRANGGDLEAVAPRFLIYVDQTRRRGVDLVLNACSSIGELCERAQAQGEAEVVRVDRAMACAAVAAGRSIAVLATLATTLGPTERLLREEAERAGGGHAISAMLAEGAYEALIAGRPAEHDARVADAIADAARRNDVVVLAQASMARAAAGLEPELLRKVLTSPAFAVEDVAQRLKAPPGNASRPG